MSTQQAPPASPIGQPQVGRLSSPLVAIRVVTPDEVRREALGARAPIAETGEGEQLVGRSEGLFAIAAPALFQGGADGMHAVLEVIPIRLQERELCELIGTAAAPGLHHG